jgi:hypothetical protein
MAHVTTHPITVPVTTATAMHVPVEEEHLRSRRRTRAVVSGAGGLAESIAAIGVVVLSILALAGVLPVTLLAIACIGAGAALVFEGAAVTSRVSTLLAARLPTSTAELEGGFAAEVLAGVAGIVLGILALIGVGPLVLPIVAAIVFGAGMLLGSGMRSRLNTLRTERGATYEQAPGAFATPTGTSATATTIENVVFVSAGGEMLVGLCVLALGILALLGFDSLVLALIAYLALGGSLLLSGTALGARLLGVLRR